MIYYLSGPMSGLPNNNIKAFNEAAAFLRSNGVEVVNPPEICTGCNNWHEYLRKDIKALCDCDGIIMLPGWEDSKGAHLELHIAHRIGIKIIFYKGAGGGFIQTSTPPKTGQGAA
jgi:hypothetical protein